MVSRSQAESRGGGARAALPRRYSDEVTDVSGRTTAWDLSPKTVKHVTLTLKAAVDERPTEQNGHCVATCEETGPGVFGSVGPFAAVAETVSNPCNLPPANECPMSPLAVPSTSSESASASSLGTHVSLVRAVTQKSPIGIRSARWRITLTIANRANREHFGEDSQARWDHRSARRIRQLPAPLRDYESKQVESSTKTQPIRQMRGWLREHCSVRTGVREAVSLACKAKQRLTANPWSTRPCRGESSVHERLANSAGARPRPSAWESDEGRETTVVFASGVE